MIAIKSIFTPARSQKLHQKSERGITLIMVLIFMVTLSLIAAVGMRGVISGERVVANQFDKASAFQAAESAGREGVAAVDAAYPGGIFPASTIAYPSPTANPKTGHPLGGNAQFWRTTSDLPKAASCIPSNSTTARFDWDNCAEQASTTYDNAEKPRYVIEKLPGVISTVTAGNADCWYRITSHATGKSKEADVILQVMYSKEITGAPTACK